MLIENKPILAENKGLLALPTTKADDRWERCSDDNYSAFYSKLEHNFWNIALSPHSARTQGFHNSATSASAHGTWKDKKVKSILHKGFYYKVVQGALLKASRWEDACEIGKGDWPEKEYVKTGALLKRTKNVKRNILPFPKLSPSLHLVCMLQMKISHELVGNSASETWFASSCWGSNLEFLGSF